MSGKVERTVKLTGITLHYCSKAKRMNVSGDFLGTTYYIRQDYLSITSGKYAP